MNSSPAPAPLPARVGVLLVNLGTPDEPTPPAVRRYLAQFLSDRRVVELPPILWQPVLRGVILNVRPRKSAALYRSIWREDSPLRTITAAQATRLSERLGAGVLVDWAMRYGSPSIPEKLQALRDARVDRLLVAPLYPQYAASATGSVLDAVFAELGRWRSVPAVRTLPAYFDHPAYIEALATLVTGGLAELPFEPEVIVASFHGLPQRSTLLGDPYEHQARATVEALRIRLGLPPDRLRLAFQSRFGRAEWLQPYTESLLRELAGAGIRRVAVIAPGFAADCLETLEELGIRAREVFSSSGGTDFAVLPCLNTSEEGIGMLHALVENELRGWIEPTRPDVVS
jgi:ferrochelatase